MAIGSKLPIIPIGQAGIKNIGTGKSIIVNSGSLYFHVGERIETTHWKEDEAEKRTKEIQEAVINSIDKARKNQYKN